MIEIPRRLRCNVEEDDDPRRHARLATLPQQSSGGGTRQAWLDVTRLRQDTGYEPVRDTKHAAADYIVGLPAGNER